MSEYIARILESYRPTHREDQHARVRMHTAIAQEPKCFERSCMPAHFTASAWVLDKPGTSVVLVHHRKLGKWVQPGGHADGNPNLLVVALQELYEECGIAGVSVAPGAFDLDVHSIPERPEMPPHDHLDVRFAMSLLSPHTLRCSDESFSVTWVRLEDVPTLTQEPSLLRMCEKTKGRWEHALPA